MNRRGVLRRAAGVVVAGTTTLIGGWLASPSRERSGTTSDEDGRNSGAERDLTPESATTTSATDAINPDDPQSVSDADQEAAIEDEASVAFEDHANPDVAEKLYAAHAKRCQCPICSGSPPGSS